MFEEAGTIPLKKPTNALDEAEHLIQMEIASIIRHEMITDPMETKKKKKSKKRAQRIDADEDFEMFDEHEIEVICVSHHLGLIYETRRLDWFWRRKFNC